MTTIIFHFNFYKIILHIYMLNLILKCAINSCNTLYKVLMAKIGMLFFIKKTHNFMLYTPDK